MSLCNHLNSDSSSYVDCGCFTELVVLSLSDRYISLHCVYSAQWATRLYSKSIFTLILNVSDKFIKTVGGVGFLVNGTWAKCGFEIRPF